MTDKTIYLLATGSAPVDAIEEAAKAGAVLDTLDFIHTESLPEVPGIEQLIASRLKVVFTSVNAVNALQRWIKGALPEWSVYCLAGATHAAVVKLSGKNSVAGTAETATQLAELIREREPGKGAGIVFFCGDRRREELPSIGVTEVVVYRTLPTPHRIDRKYDGIAFFSPSAVESFFSVNELSPEITLFAIGRTTAEAIRPRCKNPVIAPQQPDKTLLIRKMIDHFLNKR